MLPTTVHARLDINCVEHILAYTLLAHLPPLVLEHHTHTIVHSLTHPANPPLCFGEALLFLLDVSMSTKSSYLFFFISFFYLFLFLMVGKKRNPTRKRERELLNMVRSNRKVHRQ